MLSSCTPVGAAVQHLPTIFLALKVLQCSTYDILGFRCAALERAAVQHLLEIFGVGKVECCGVFCGD